MAKPENKGKQGHRWQKGESGNPKGRPKGYPEFRELCREHTPKAVDALVAALTDPDTMVPAAKVLLEFGWGKPSQALDVTSSDGSLQVVINKLPREG